MVPSVGSCSPTKTLMAVDLPAPLAPITATRLTWDTVLGIQFEQSAAGDYKRRTQTWPVRLKCQAHVHDGGLVLGGVGEADVVHAQDDLASALHALQRTRLREHEAHVVVPDLEVRLLLGVLLHEPWKLRTAPKQAAWRLVQGAGSGSGP